MSILKKSIFLIGLLFSLSAEIKPFALITVPKSGSHMIIKALHFMTGSEAIWHTHFPSFFYVPPEHGYLYTHFCLSPQLEQNYRDLPELRKIIMIRDLRDVCVSIVHQIRKAPWPGLSAKQRDAFLDLSFDEQLLFVINYEYDVYEVARVAPNSLQCSVIRIAEQALQYSRDPSNLVCRYEDLVGPMGGGNQEAQVEEMRKIADYIGLPYMSESWLADAASRLYGNEFDPFGKQGLKNFQSTFNRGQIGAWRQFFKDKHIRAFKEKLGRFLIALDYEKDEYWQ